jgi:hypothetical protein
MRRRVADGSHRLDSVTWTVSLTDIGRLAFPLTECEGIAQTVAEADNEDEDEDDE